jgi:hypothetical protein
MMWAHSVLKRGVTRKFQTVQAFFFRFPAYLDLKNKYLENAICAKTIGSCPNGLQK